MLFNGDCLEVMKTLDDKSIDLVFCDLPYGQTSCKWNCKIDLEKFWIEVMRIKKLNTPIFFTTTTKFGVELINTAPKKCPFRYDLVWVKSAPAGFLSAKKMPMRKHEMIYVFYEKLPLYDLSRHTHKFIKKEEVKKVERKSTYGKIETHDLKTGKNNGVPRYDPPLPVSVVKEPEPEPEKVYSKIDGGREIHPHPNSAEGSRYDPPLPVSVVKEGDITITELEPEPEIKYDPNEGATMINGTLGGAYDSRWQKGHQGNSYDPPLPNSLLEIKSTRGKHSTQKPVALMEWILSYYSKEGDIILDPTMGSGSTGVACKNLNRKFIGIELDKEIFEVAKSRNPEELVKG